MEAPKPTYEFYVSEFGGTQDEAAFSEQLLPASIEVGDMCSWKEVPKDAETAYKLAICSIVDIYAENGFGVVGGFSVGSFSMSAPMHDVKRYARGKASQILFPTGLLYAGVE